MDQGKKNGPFGLWMGMSVEQVDAHDTNETTQGEYLLASVPKPHSAFEMYVAQIGKINGLSLVRAVSHQIETSVYGIELKNAFESMKDKLDKAYGNCELSDFLMPDSIWEESADWMTALTKKERVLMSSWDKQKGLDLKNDLESITLIALADEDSVARLILDYEFANHKECSEEISSEADAML